MASIQKKGDSYNCRFCYNGKRHTVTLGNVGDDEAETFAGKVDYLLMRLKQKLMHVPAGVEITDFVLSDGRIQPDQKEVEPSSATYKDLQERFLQTHGNGSKEASTMLTIRIHLRHLERSLGPQFPLQELEADHLQRHIDQRTKGKKKVSAYTVRKEITTFRSVWNWGLSKGLVREAFPNNGLSYPKLDEKPPFMTWAEIEKHIRAGADAKLWDCLYLNREEIDGLLTYVRENGTQPWVYPLVYTAAHTGARRSELLRVELLDVNFEERTIRIREKKRSSKRTYRVVPISDQLRDVLKAWIARHPGGKHLFCQQVRVERSKTKRTVPTPVTWDEAHDHLKRTLEGSKWNVLRGYHVLRHSFVSCLASAGTDQRIIDDCVGHQTEEQRVRYRHLFPDVKKNAINDVFGRVTSLSQTGMTKGDSATASLQTGVVPGAVST